MKNVKVTQMTSRRTGEAVRNQFILTTPDGVYFQSYDSVIAFKPSDGRRIQLDEKLWDYSVTTGKYRTEFLNEKKAETQAKIDSGVYELVDLNEKEEE